MRIKLLADLKTYILDRVDTVLMTPKARVPRGIPVDEC